jgi:hypothetical protein
MQYLTSYLTGIFDRLVVDRTGLKNAFDFKVEVGLDENDIITDKRAAVNCGSIGRFAATGVEIGAAKGIGGDSGDGSRGGTLRKLKPSVRVLVFLLSKS